MKGGEAAVRDVESREGGTCVTGYFGPLARGALPAEGLDIPGHAVPDKTTPDVLESGIAPGMGQTMDVDQEGMYLGGGYDGPRRRPGDGGVAEDQSPGR